MSEATTPTGHRSAACPVCHAAQFKTWRWSGLESCTACGHVRKSSGATPSRNVSIQEAYFDANFALQADPFSGFYQRMNARRRVRTLRRFVPIGRVLEVGVGHGTLLLKLRAAGYEVRGIDTSEQVCRVLQTRYQLPVQRATVESLAEATPAATYDLVIMCHVLEHMESPSAALRAASRLLKPSGLLYLAVPNLAAWNSYLPGWTAYEPYHLHYFRSPHLRRVLERSGFAVLRETTFEPISGWFNAVARSLRRHSPDLEPRTDGSGAHIRAGHPMWIAYDALRLAGGIMLSPLRWTQSMLGRGEELVVIARVRAPSPASRERTPSGSGATLALAEAAGVPADVPTTGGRVSTGSVLRCEICHGTRVRLWATVGGYDHYRCRTCLYLYVYPRPPAELVEQYYLDGTFYAKAESEEARLAAEATTRVRALSALAAQFGLARQLLDAGCASGVFLEEAQRGGWSVAGIEPSPILSARARGRGLNVTTGWVEDLPNDSTYPVVTAWEVIEHAADALEFLAALRSRVQPGGLVALATPLSNGLPARLLGSRFPMICPPEHIRLFSRRAILLLGQSLGLRMIRFRSFSNLRRENLERGLARLLLGRVTGADRVARRPCAALAAALSPLPRFMDALGMGSEMEVVFRRDP